MRDLVEVARRYLTKAPARQAGSPSAVSSFYPLSPFFHPTGPGESFPVGPEPWEESEARLLIGECRAAVIRLGADTRNSELASAARMVASAFATRDMETIRFACSEFAIVVRKVASRGSPRQARGR